MHHEYLTRGFRLDEANNRTLFNIRNLNNLSEDKLQFEGEKNVYTKTPPVALISNLYEKKDNLNCDHYGYKQNYENRARPYDSTRNDFREPERSRSRSPQFAPSRNEHREDHYPLAKASSPNRDFRGEVNRNNFREMRFCPSRSPNRSFNTIQTETFRNETRRDPIRKRSSSYSPERGRREKYYRSSRSRSPKREFNERKIDQYVYDTNIDQERRVNTRRSHSRSYSPLRNNYSEGHYPTIRTRSPHDRHGEEFYMQHDTFKDEMRRYSNRESSRSNSPFTKDHRQEHYRSSRSCSPTRGFIEAKREGYFVRNDKYENTIQERRSSRHYSPKRNDHRKELYQSSRSRSPNRRFNSVNERRIDFSSQNIHFIDERKNKNYYTSSQETSASNVGYLKRSTSSDLKGFRNNSNRISQNQNIPSLLKMDVSFNSEQKCERNLQNRNIPSLLSLGVFSGQKDFSKPSNFSQIKHHNQETNKKTPHHYNKNQSKFVNKGIRASPSTTNQHPALKKNIANIPIIQSGLKKPAPGHVKANPRDYWSQWWPQYKYIEISAPRIDPDDYEVKSCLNFLFKPGSEIYRKRKYLLLRKGVRTVIKTIDIDETNYYVRDIYKLFQYKKHLEDPNFQNSLTPDELNIIAPALRQFQKKTTMVFLHQAIITRWHISFDILKKVQAGQPILSNYARVLLNEKSFHYLVVESIKELKVHF